MALTLLRHAPLPPQYQGRYNGWTDISIDRDYRHIDTPDVLCTISFDHIYSSDLIRCTQTLDAMGIKHYHTESRLREVRFKAHIEGRSFEEISQLSSYDESYLQDATAWHRFVCAESPQAFKRRIVTFLRELPQDKEILLCSHAGTLQTILSLFGLNKPKIAYLETIRIEQYVLHEMV